MIYRYAFSGSNCAFESMPSGLVHHFTCIMYVFGRMLTLEATFTAGAVTRNLANLSCTACLSSY